MRIILIAFILSTCFAVHGQQNTQFSQWMLNQYAVNPAHAGIKKCVDIHSMFRMQWVGFEGAPKNGFLTVSMPIRVRSRRMMPVRHGTGFKFELDRIGQFSSHRFNFSYAAHFNISKKQRFSFGLRGGVMQLSYDPINVQTTTVDPIITSETALLLPDATFGAWYNAEKFYLGFVAQNLFPSRWQNIGLSSRNRMHFIFNGAYQIGVNEKFSVFPGFLARIPPKGKLSVDLNVNFDFNDVFMFGVGFRNTDAFIAMVSLKISNQFSINYSFDYTISDIQNVARNTHEVSLSFSTCKRKKASSVSCPLFE